MTVMTRSSAYLASTYNTENSQNSQYTQTNMINSNTYNHGKRWTSENDNYLKKAINKNIITRNDIESIAANLGRTYGAVKSRILTYYIQDNFDYETGDNSKLLKKYLFATEEDIEWYALRNHTKKDKLKYKLNKVMHIVDSMKNKINANDYERIINTITSIDEENN